MERLERQRLNAEKRRLQRADQLSRERQQWNHQQLAGGGGPPSEPRGAEGAGPSP
eukprot:gene50357-18690_t